MQVGGFFTVGDVQVAVTFTLTFVTLLLALVMLQGDQLCLPGRSREHAEVRLGAVPVRGLAVAQGLVAAVDAFDPAFQSRTQEFQARVIDDQALHAALSFIVVIETANLWLFDITDIRVAQDDKDAIDPGQCCAFH
ncbi:hypothetical protein D3C84_823580 [compost metagenome]